MQRLSYNRSDSARSMAASMTGKPGRLPKQRRMVVSGVQYVKTQWVFLTL